ncbi:MAG TPA: hypothetical protein VN962_20765 [Polyangia bacterium]|nr:hypothetical protein [Polyangia bacterium]
MPPGVPPEHSLAVALLVAGLVLGLARQVAVLARTRRNRARADQPVRWDVRLREPLWSRATAPVATLALAALLGAVGARVGSAGVGAGLAVTVALMGLGVHWASERWSPRDLMFAADGLHVGLRRCRFVISWSDIAGVETTPGGDFTEVRVLSVARAAGSAAPGDRPARTQVAYALYDGSEVTGRLLVAGALAGLDGATLARAIHDAASTRSAAQPN